jgi:hemerythrin superfamily protein
MGLFTSASSGVVNMLKADHKKVKGLFEQFKSAEGRERGAIAKTTIQELEIHADLEETLIYPAIRKEIDEKDMMNEAVEEHHLVHVLIKELKNLQPRDETFQAKFTVLGELVNHHAEEEEDEMLPKAEDTDLDWESLESRVVKRRETLMAKANGNGGKSSASRGAKKSKGKKPSPR